MYCCKFTGSYCLASYQMNKRTFERYLCPKPAESIGMKEKILAFETESGKQKSTDQVELIGNTRGLEGAWL